MDGDDKLNKKGCSSKAGGLLLRLQPTPHPRLTSASKSFIAAIPGASSISIKPLPGLPWPGVRWANAFALAYSSSPSPARGEVTMKRPTLPS